ncbi:MAG: T9SS type A sorting domain-containing protein [Calditrichaeota bacterium]|nr:T9SS type A sorting domain-containing protein [Calditrichota bacterium]
MRLPTPFYWLTAFVVISGIFFIPGTVNATRPLSLPNNQLWSAPDSPDGPNRLTRPSLRNPNRDFDNYIGQLQLIVDFLDSLQEQDPEHAQFGGMHEGETGNLWAIVETDNTQEAIRVWCEYAAFFEDTESYSQNIADAWTYCDNHPAWEEALGNPDALYYSLHNSGWGLIAEMRYRELYDDSRREYSLNCADHIAEDAPNIEVDQEDRLMPLVLGLASGTLYEYGILEDSEEYRNAAVRIAENVQTWIDHDLERLHHNEIWAMCGGTAMWGVLRALGKNDSAATANWANARLEEMDVIAGAGQWNNSWNIWYAHAWHEAFMLTGSEDYRDNAIFIVDSLLAQDYDEDGGIPATIGDPLDEDQSWVTAYTGWMGLSNLFVELPQVNAGIIDLISPDITRPYSVNDIHSFTFRLENAGITEDINIPVSIRGAFNFDGEIQAEGWQPIEWQLEEPWQPQESGEIEFMVFTDHPEDGDRTNDSLTLTMDIRPVADLNLSTQDIDGNPVHTTFFFYNHELDPSEVYQMLETNSDNGSSESEMMVGVYSVAIVPDFPYPAQRIEEYNVTEGRQNRINRQYEQPPVLLVNRDTDSTNADYYKTELEAELFPYYHWRSEDLGVVSDHTTDFETIIYFTGDRQNETIPPEDRNELSEALAAGRNVFVTGQYIANDLQDDPFLSEFLHATFLDDSIGTPMVEGIEGDEVLGDMSMLLMGNRGANNQRGRAGIAVVEGGISCAVYQNRPDTAAAVRWEEENGAKGMFLAFGFEGISGSVGSSRNEIMVSVLEWMNTSRQDVIEKGIFVSPFSMNLINAYPNPTNGGVRFDFSHPVGSSVNIEVIDLQGRRIAIFPAQTISNGMWNGTDWLGSPVSTGKYYIRLVEPNSNQVIGSTSVLMIR